MSSEEDDDSSEDDTSQSESEKEVKPAAGAKPKPAAPGVKPAAAGAKPAAAKPAAAKPVAPAVKPAPKPAALPPKPAPRKKKPGEKMRWGDYPAVGNVIEGTRLICFKAPLDRSLPSNPDHDTFTSTQLLTEHMQARGRTLGMVVDLTDTYKFYSPYDAFEVKRVDYFKLFCPGIDDVPPKIYVDEFNDMVFNFLKKTAGESDINGMESLIGVHCLNGVNRTGYFVCQFMIQYLEIPAMKAIKSFEESRGVKIDSKEVLQALCNPDAKDGASKKKAASKKKSKKKKKKK